MTTPPPATERDARPAVLVLTGNDLRDDHRAVRRQAVLDHRSVARLEHVEREDRLGEEHDLRQRKDRDGGERLLEATRTPSG